MAIKLGSNIASLNAQRRLAEAGSELSKTFERLSSGQRINRASDDAAGLAIADDLKAKSRIYTQAIRNGNDGVSLLNIADSAIDALTSVVVRIRELSEQAANGTYSSKQRAALDLEAQQLSQEFTRITQSTSFNGLKIFDGSLGSGIRLQLGNGVTESINTSIGGAIGTGSFNISSLFTSQGEKRDVQFADLNNDGILDLVSVGSIGSSNGLLSIRLGKGDGSFGTEIGYTTDGNHDNPAAIAIGDLDGDNILDIVATGYGGKINVRFGKGDGTFSNSTIYTVGNNNNTIHDVLLGDLNGDNILDIISVGYNFISSYETLTIRLGTGNGQFASASVLTSSSILATYSGSLADLNNDGNLDIVTVGIDIGSGKTAVRYGDGKGSFGAATIYTSTGYQPVAVELGDLNGDGILDMVTAGYDMSSGLFGTTGVRLGRSDGSFGSLTTYTSEAQISWDLKLADVNGDGILDMATTGSGTSSGEITIRLGNGNGTFGDRIVKTIAGTGGKGLAFGDLNGDGVLDLATAGYGASGAGQYHVLLANTKEGLGAIESFSLKTREGALSSMALLDKTIKNLAKQRGTIGSSQSRVNIAIQNLQTSKENFLAAESRIRDADIAQESANLVRTQILQQAAASVLSQANQLPSLALKLLS